MTFIVMKEVLELTEDLRTAAMEATKHYYASKSEYIVEMDIAEELYRMGYRKKGWVGTKK